MASFVSSTTSVRTVPFCACGFGMCVVKISNSSRNSGRAYYQCPCAVPCHSWIGWCDEFGQTSVPGTQQSLKDMVIQLRADIINLQHSLHLLQIVTFVLSVVIVILLFRT
ncbi:hypothetical protein CsSME_00040601 [Camellia sinensis var. sinensis]